MNFILYEECVCVSGFAIQTTVPRKENGKHHTMKYARGILSPFHIKLPRQKAARSGSAVGKIDPKHTNLCLSIAIVDKLFTASDVSHR